MTRLQTLLDSPPDPRAFIAYKVDSKGKERGWMAYGTREGVLVQISGLLDSEKFVTNEKFRPGKNIGKSNETTPEEQSWLEAESSHKKKLDKDYYASLDEANNTLTILPMLAESYDKYGSRIDWSGSVYVQPKLDGMRCLAVCTYDSESQSMRAQLVSRQGKDIMVTTRGAMQHVLDAVVEAANNQMHHLDQHMVCFAFDGELYADELGFQDSMSAIKKLKKNTSLIKFHVYDMVEPHDNTLGFADRAAVLERRVSGGSSGVIQLVETNRIECEECLIEAHAKYLAAGYEGTVVRHGDAPYKIKGRSRNLLKYKDFIDIAVPIVDIEPTDGRPSHGTPVCKLKDGRTFSCGTKMSHEAREELLTNRDDYIGQTAEVRFFEYTDAGLPRFPVCVGVRNDK